MATDVILLRLGSTTMESAVVLDWFVAVGESVEEGDPLVAVETDKVEVELPSPASGILLEQVAPGTEVEVGGKLGRIGTPEELASKEDQSQRPSQEDLQTGAEEGQTRDGEDEALASDPHDESARETVRAAPAARKLAREIGIDLSDVRGTGPEGRIQSSDVRAAVSGDSNENGREAASEAIRRRTAERMERSSRETAAVTVSRQIDAGPLMEMIATAKAAGVNESGRLPSIEDYVIQACGKALRAHPDFNASWFDGALQPNAEIDINVAIQTKRGLVAPVIWGVDRLDLGQIATERGRITALALDGALAADQVAGGSFTVTNLGGLGVDIFTPIITVPQVAILGVGRVVDGVIPSGRGVTITPMMWLSLTFDHRALDGAPAAGFLAAVAEWLEGLNAA